MRFSLIAASLIAAVAAQAGASDEVCSIVTVTVTETMGQNTPIAPSSLAPYYPTTTPAAPAGGEGLVPEAGTAAPPMGTGTAAPSGTGAGPAYPEFTGAAAGLQQVGGLMAGMAGLVAVLL